MIKAIVYKSKRGHTKVYADILKSIFILYANRHWLCKSFVYDENAKEIIGYIRNS